MLLSTGSKRVGHNSATEQQQPTSLDLKFSYMIIFSAGSLLPIGSVGVGVHSFFPERITMEFMVQQQPHGPVRPDLPPFFTHCGPHCIHI